MKSITIAIVAFLILVGTFTFFKFSPNPESNSQQGSKTQATTQATSATPDDNFMSSLLDGYPEAEVPLYKAKQIESIKYFVNDDPVNVDGFLPAKINYYNVVFASEAKQADFLAYYRSKMSKINEKTSDNSRVEGVIGSYLVSASDYGSGTSYLQVALPSENFSKTNPFFTDYPQLVELNPLWVEHESSFGKLNQSGGQIEYTQYFTVKRDEMDNMLETYSQKYSDKDSFSANATGGLHWREQNYDISLSFAKDHGRVYLMIRKPK